MFVHFSAKSSPTSPNVVSSKVLLLINIVITYVREQWGLCCRKFVPQGGGWVQLVPRCFNLLFFSFPWFFSYLTSLIVNRHKRKKQRKEIRKKERRKKETKKERKEKKEERKKERKKERKEERKNDRKKE